AAARATDPPITERRLSLFMLLLHAVSLGRALAARAVSCSFVSRSCAWMPPLRMTGAKPQTHAGRCYAGMRFLQWVYAGRTTSLHPGRRRQRAGPGYEAAAPLRACHTR